MKIAFSATVLARGLAGSGIDGIGSYTRDLGAALADAGAPRQAGTPAGAVDPSRIVPDRLPESVTVIPVGFGVDVPQDAIPGAASAQRLPAYASSAVRSALLPVRFDAGPLPALGVDLFHATDHLVPRFADLPVVATLMDAIPLSHPEWVRTRFAPLKRWLWRRAAGWADRILTISTYSKGQLVEHFGLPDDRIDVTPLGVDPRRFERIARDERLRVLRRLGLPEGFFLSVGTLQPRKNVERALDAHARLPERLREALPFVVVGRAGWGCELLVRRLEAADAQPGSGVRWLRYLPEHDLAVLMQSASALVFPSLCEGFGLPVVEAFAAGLPVVTSNTTSLPEVAEGAALLVDPMRVDAITEAMVEIIDSPGLASRLVESGHRRARALSWSACAKATLACYRRVL
ncbi:MAG: hypothetical protein RIS35_2043 [Pseudomonadota bacterium]|jgi:alpha-1,3-rhamnosyl/mannosyltransferase